MTAELPPVEVWHNGQKIDGWVWVSFATEDEFLGAVITEEARWPMLGLFGLNPGGEMTVVSIPPEHLPPPEFRNRLLSREEAEAL